MSRPPIEPGVAGMTRRNYLVERNKLRVAQYEPTRKQLEEEELKRARQQMLERQERHDTWKNTFTSSTATVSRPLPGGGPRSERMKATAHQRHTNTLQAEREMEALKKAEYQRVYDADVREQLREREATLKKMRDEEAQQMAALRELNAARDRRVAEEERRLQLEQKAYMDRMRRFNLEELEKKRADKRASDERDVAMIRSIQRDEQHRAEVDERREKDTKRMLQLQNEEFHKKANQRSVEDKAREAAELAAIMERDRLLAQEEREACIGKKEQFRKEFEESIARDQEFRRLHNYDETPEATRRRNELAAESYRLIRREEQLRSTERKKEYEAELMQQIQYKQQYQLTHLDGL